MSLIKEDIKHQKQITKKKKKSKFKSEGECNLKSKYSFLTKTHYLLRIGFGVAVYHITYKIIIVIGR